MCFRKSISLRRTASFVSLCLRARDSSCSFLAFDLRYYAECRDLDYLLESLDSEPGLGKGRMKALNRAMVELVEDYGLVSFETLAVEVSCTSGIFW